MISLAERLATIPGVQAVALGGSRARGVERPDSDWDFGLYYRGAIDTDAIRSFGFEGEVFEPGQWGRIPNGGAWLIIDDQRVDLIYRDLDQVEHWTREAEQGRFEVYREVGYVAGVATYTLAGELALNQVLSGSLPQPTFPEPLKHTASKWWHNIAKGALKFAEAHDKNSDAIPAQANLAVAALALANAKCAKEGVWALNEKRLLQQAGLSFLSPLSYEELEAAIASEG